MSPFKYASKLYKFSKQQNLAGLQRSFFLWISQVYLKCFRLAAELSGDIIAGSFGKCKSPEAIARLKQSPNFAKDVVRSLLLMISNQIGQVFRMIVLKVLQFGEIQSAVLYAETNDIKKIYFNGYLIRNHPIIMRTFSYAIEFWSQVISSFLCGYCAHNRLME